MAIDLDKRLRALDDLRPSDLWERIEADSERPRPYVVATDATGAPSDAPDALAPWPLPPTSRREAGWIVAAAMIVIAVLVASVTLARPDADPDRVTSGPSSEPWQAIGSTTSLRGPVALATDPHGRSLWVLNTSATLVELDPSTLATRRTVGLGHIGVRDVAVGAGGVWVVHDDGFVTLVDPATGAASSSAVAGEPLAVAAIDDEAWVVLGGGAVAQLAVDGSGAVAERARVPIPGAAAIAVSSSSVWVTDGSGVVELDRSGRRVRRLTGLPGAGVVTIGSDGRVWFDLETRPGEVGYLAPATGALLGAHDVGVQATAMASGGRTIWVADGQGELVAVDAASVATEQPLSIGEVAGSIPAADPERAIADVAAFDDEAWLAVPGRHEVVHVRALR